MITQESIVALDRVPSLFDNSAMPQLLLEENRFIDCNKKALELIGVSDKEALIGLTPADISPVKQLCGLSSEKKSDIYIKIARSKGHLHFEWVHWNKQHRYIYSLVSLNRIIINNRDLLHVALFDISNIKQMELSLLESEGRYKLLSDLTYEGIIIHDNGITIDVNMAFCKMFNFKRNEIIGKNIIDLIIHNKFKKAVYQNSLNQITTPYEVLCKKKSGALLWVEIRGKPISHNGKTVRVVSMLDITDRKNVHRITEESEKKFQRITESTLDILITTDRNKIIKSVSPSIARYTGYKPEELIERNLETLIPSNTIKKIRNKINDTLAGKKITIFESRILRKDESTAFVEVTIVKTTGAKRKTELEFYMRDISEQKNLEQELIKTSERERQHIGQNLHDGLGQVLTGISMMLGTLARKIQLKNRITPKEVLQIARRVEEAIETTRQTAKGLYPVAIEKAGIVSALHEMAIKIENDLNIKCTVMHQGDESISDLHMATQLYYISQEAINNAIKHARPERIDVKIIIHDNQIILTITNNININKIIKTDGMGLKIMKYRTDIIGGTFNIRKQKKQFQIHVEIKLGNNI